MSNHVILAQLLDMTAQDMANIPIDQIEMLLEESAKLKSAAKHYDTLISGELSRRFADQAQAERRLQCKDTGTVRLACGDHVIVADSPKEVTWDQAELHAQFTDISENWPDAATDYINVKYSVDERKFTAWPPSLQKSFETARTVKTGKATYKIESKKEAA